MSRRVRSDFDAELLLRLGNRSDITSVQRGFFLDDGYLDICNRFVHVQLQAISPTETLTQGSDNFTPAATGFWYPTGLRNVTDGYMIPRDNRDRVERAQTKPTSRPYRYYWYGGTFYFEAFADTQKTMKCWFKQIPPAWVGGSPIIDQIFDPLILMAAAKIGFETVRDFDQATAEEQSIMRNAEEKKLPLQDAKLNDYRTGFKVRFK